MASEYAKSIIQKGIACSDHTCNNPLLNQMVVPIISIPGVLSPELVEQFKLAVEQMAKQPLDEQVKERSELIKKLSAPAPDESEYSKSKAEKLKPENTENQTENEIVEGYKMKKIDNSDDSTEMTSSGVQWLAICAVVAIMGLMLFGARKKKT